VAGGVQRLAKATGFSKDGVTSVLRLLVEKGVLVRAPEATRGRPRTVYRLATRFRATLLKFGGGKSWQSWLIRILKADEEPFCHLPILDRALLAFLWSQGPMTGVIDGESVSRLAGRAGIDRAGFTRLIHRLHRKGMLVASKADFAVDGATNKTKTYFLLGPAVVSGWAKSSHEEVKINGALGWLAGDDADFSGEALLAKIEERAPGLMKDWKAFRDDLPLYWQRTAGRNYVLMQCCAALSHAFSVTRNDSTLWWERVLLSKIQSALVRMHGLPMVGTTSYGSALEEVDLHGLDSRLCALLAFIEEVSIFLLEELRKTLSPVFLPARGMRAGVRMVNCYPVDDAGVKCMRVVFVADDAVGDKFGVNFPAERKREHQGYRLVLLDQVPDIDAI